jgi:hypothetical protein
MPNTPISQLVLANVKTALETAAGATYFETFADVIHFEDYDFDATSASLPVAIIHPGDERVVRRMKRGTSDLLELEWTLTVLALDHAGSSRSEGWGTGKVAELRHDIIKRLMLDITRGGYAVNTQLDSAAWFPDEFNRYDAAVAVGINVTYRHIEADPSAQ